MRLAPYALLGSIAVILSAAGCASQPAAGNDGGVPGGGNDSATTAASRVAMDGFITAGPWAGYGFTATDPGAAMITPNCTSSCTPPFTGTTFCMQGTVTGRADYSGFAMLGWNVNQPAGTTAMMTWPVPDTGGVTVTVTNDPPGTALRVQLQGTDPHSATDRWCAPLISGQRIEWSAFKTNCWSGGSPQNALTPGTMIQQAAVMVPGLTTTLPFDICLVDIQIDP